MTPEEIEQEQQREQERKYKTRKNKQAHTRFLFYKQLHFWVEPRVALQIFDLSLKVAKWLLRKIFGNYIKASIAASGLLDN